MKIVSITPHKHEYTNEASYAVRVRTYKDRKVVKIKLRMMYSRAKALKFAQGLARAYKFKLHDCSVCCDEWMA